MVFNQYFLPWAQDWLCCEEGAIIFLCLIFVQKSFVPGPGRLDRLVEPFRLGHLRRAKRQGPTLGCWLSISSECAGGGSLRCRESSRALSLMVLGGRDVRAQARGLVGREVREIDMGVTLSGRGQRVRVCAWSEGLESEALLTRSGRPNVRRDFCSSRRSRSVTVTAGASWQCPATKLAGQVHPRAGLGGLRRGHRRPALGVRSREDEVRG